MKKLYWLLEFDGVGEFDQVSLVMSFSGLTKWIKDDVGDLEKECPKSYRVTPVWLTKKEVNALQEADI